MVRDSKYHWGQAARLALEGKSSMAQAHERLAMKKKNLLGTAPDRESSIKQIARFYYAEPEDIDIKENGEVTNRGKTCRGVIVRVVRNRYRFEMTDMKQ